jgi:hypothetical protein
VVLTLWLARQPAVGCVWRPALLAHLGTQGVMQALPVTTSTPLAKVPLDTRPFGILMGEQAPCDAPIDDIKNSIDHCPHIKRAMAPTWLGWGDYIFEKIPFGIRKVCSVGYGWAVIPPVFRTDAAYGRLFKQPLSNSHFGLPRVGGGQLSPTS